MGKVTRYSYVQIESAVKVNEPGIKRRNAVASGYFTIALNFYNKELDAAKKKVIKFTIREHDDTEEEESKSFSGHGADASSRRSNVTIKGSSEQEGLGGIEFSVLYML